MFFFSSLKNYPEAFWSERLQTNTHLRIRNKIPQGTKQWSQMEQLGILPGEDKDCNDNLVSLFKK